METFHRELLTGHTEHCDFGGDTSDDLRWSATLPEASILYQTVLFHRIVLQGLVRSKIIPSSPLSFFSAREPAEMFLHNQGMIRWFQTMADFLTFCPLFHVLPLPVARAVKCLKISGRGVFSNYRVSVQ